MSDKFRRVKSYILFLFIAESVVKIGNKHGAKIMFVVALVDHKDIFGFLRLRGDFEVLYHQV